MALLDKFLILFDTDSTEATKDVDGLNKKLGDTEKDANSAVRGMDSAGDSADGMAFNFAKAAETAGTLLASFAALSAMKDQIVNTANMDDAIGKLTMTYGLSIKQVDAWGAAMERNGGSAETLFGTVVSLQDQLGQIRFGGGTEIIKTLSMMGISASGANGQMKDSFQILEELSKVFEGMDARRSAAMGARLGLDQSTILMLQQGRHNLKQLVDQQEQLGNITKEGSLIAADFNDAQDNLGRSFKGVWQIVNNAVLPVLTEMFNLITDGVQWMKENEDFTVGLIIGIAAAIATFALPAVWSLATAIWGLMAPILAVVAPIAAVGVAIALLYEDVKAYMDGHSSLIGDLAKKYGWFKALVDGLIGGFKALWADLTDLFDWTMLLVTSPAEAMNQMTSKLMQELSQLWDWIVNLFDFSFISDSIGSMADMLGFGDNEDADKIMQNTNNILITSEAYALNPLNSYNPYGASGAGSAIYNQNNFSFNNQIAAKGVTAEQVNGQLTTEFGRQVSAAGALLDDGIAR